MCECVRVGACVRVRVCVYVYMCNENFTLFKSMTNYGTEKITTQIVDWVISL